LQTKFYKTCQDHVLFYPKVKRSKEKGRKKLRVQMLGRLLEYPCVY